MLSPWFLKIHIFNVHSFSFTSRSLNPIHLALWCFRCLLLMTIIWKKCWITKHFLSVRCSLSAFLFPVSGLVIWDKEVECNGRDLLVQLLLGSYEGRVLLPCPPYFFCIICKLLSVLNKMKPMQIFPVLHHLYNKNKKTVHNCLLQIMFCLAIFLSVAALLCEHGIFRNEGQAVCWFIYPSGCLGST